MASVKVKFRPSTVSGAEGTLYYQIIHKGIIRQIHSGCKVLPSEWDNRDARIVLPDTADNKRRNYLISLEQRIMEDVLRIWRCIIMQDAKGKSFTAEEVVVGYLSTSCRFCFISFGRQLINELIVAGKARTAETYRTSLNSFGRFRNEDGDIPLDSVDSNLMMTYETWLKGQGLCPNSTSYYMRNLRAVYNRAVERGLTEQQNPFRHVYTGIDKTVKRAISLDYIRQIRDIQLPPSLAFARDIFMFSFYTRGMSFVDMAYLKKKDLRNGVLSYRRKKTNQQLFIRWEKPMQEIIDRYFTPETSYMLPIIKCASKNERKQYTSAAHRINLNLKKIGNMLGLPIPLTTYVARHGWASIARSKNIPIATISEAMGHGSEKTTRIYLASLDTSVVDRANHLVLKSL